MDHIRHYDSPLGGITLAGSEHALTGLWFDGQKHFGRALAEERFNQPLPVLEDAARWLDCYFRGEQPGFTPPLFLRGTPFQAAVWRILLTIPYGFTMTYGEIARSPALSRGLSSPSPRAVGAAVSRNPISLIVPCHRVIGADGSLTGYAGGTDRKRFLLELERKTLCPAGISEKQRGI